MTLMLRAQTWNGNQSGVIPSRSVLLPIFLSLSGGENSCM